jgi:diacylglycerol kinase family enzyme
MGELVNLAPEQSIGTILVVVNTHSSNARTALPALAELQAAFGTRVLPEIFTRECPEDTIEAVQEELMAPDVTHCCVISGDHGTNCVATAIHELESNVTLLPLGGGNANDIATMLNGKPQKYRPSELLSQPAQDVAPIACTLSDARGTSEHLSFGYLSIGATGYASALLNDPGLRSLPGYQRRFIRTLYEPGLIAATLAGAEPFHIIDEELDGPHEQYELTFLNGTIMGKHRLVSKKIAHDLNTDTIFMSELRERRLSEVARWVGRTLMRSQQGTVLNKPYECMVLTDEQAPVYTQFDGEPYALRHDTTMRVAKSPHAVPMIGTRLPTKEPIEI